MPASASNLARPFGSKAEMAAHEAVAAEVAEKVQERGVEAREAMQAVAGDTPAVAVPADPAAPAGAFTAAADPAAAPAGDDLSGGQTLNT